MGCAWCSGSLAGMRRDARYCSQSCRQAAHRFGAGAATVAVGRQRSVAPGHRRFGYGDPPYRGKSKLYVGHPDYAGEVDQRELIERMVDEFPDGWALSCSSESLQDLLSWCPRTVRVAAWMKGERATRSHRPLASWEPVIYHGGHAEPSEISTRRIDALVYGVAPRLTDPKRVIGAKPAVFWYWLFDLLAMVPGDEFVDLFPGSGGGDRAWAEVSRRADPGDGSAPAVCDGSPRAAHDGSAAGGSDGCSPGGRDGSAQVLHDGSTVVLSDGTVVVQPTLV